MNAMHALTAALLVLLIGSLYGCKSDENARLQVKPCTRDADCLRGQICTSEDSKRGFCVEEEDPQAPDADGETPDTNEETPDADITPPEDAPDGSEDPDMPPPSCDEVGCESPAPTCEDNTLVLYEPGQCDPDTGACDEPVEVSRTKCEDLGLECIPGDSECRDIEGCRHACPDGTHCQISTGECRECLTDLHCSLSESCDEETFVCVSLDIECSEDPLEDNNTLETAASISPEQDLSNLSICTGDQDWFAISLQAGQTAQAVMNYYEQFGALDMRITDENGTTLRRSETDTDSKTTTFRTSTDNTVFLHVYGTEESTNLYTLDLDISNIFIPCEDDQHEENNIFAQASTISQGTHNLSFCGSPGDDEEDWFYTDLFSIETAHITLEDPSGDLRMSIYDNIGTYIATASDRNDQEELYIVHEGSNSRGLNIQIWSDRNDSEHTTTTYTLEVRIDDL